MLEALRVEQLISELGDRNKQRRAAHVLIRLGKFVLNDLIGAMENQDEDRAVPLAAIIAQIGSPAVEPLVKALEIKSDPFYQRTIIEILGEIGDERAIKPLQTILAAEDQIFFDEALDALTNIGCRQLSAILPKNSL